MRTQVLLAAKVAGHSLGGVIDRPAGKPRAWALFAHCFTCGKNLPAADTIAAALATAGIGVLRIDFTGLGSSEGEFADTNFSTNVGDLVRAAEWLLDHEGAGPSLLIGHSLGGAAILAAAADIPSARAVATIASPAAPAHVLKLLSPDDLERINAEGESRVSVAGRPFSMRRQLLEDLCGQTLEKTIERLDKALLVLHSPRDATVGIDSASTIFGWAKHPKSYVSLDDADHLMRSPTDARYAGEIIAAWANRYLPSLAQTPSASEVTVATSGFGRLQHNVAAGRHYLVADEPRGVGGDDAGPSPYDYLLAALGACTAITMKLYAERKGLALDAVEIDVSHTRGDAGEHILRRIRIAGALSADDRRRLIEIAGKCPVHKTLSGPVDIETVTVEV